MNTLAKALVAASAALAATGTDAAVYVGSHSFGATTVNLSITTDDTLGPLARGNVTAFTITLSNHAGTRTITQNDARVSFLSGTAFQATAGDLAFDFDGNGVVQFDNLNDGGSDLLCFTAATSQFTCRGLQQHQNVQVANTSTSTSRTGRFVLGTAATSAVPEPATWAMMLLGFGGLGFALRRPRQTVRRIRFN